MDEKERIGVVPDASLYHDKDTYMIEVELPGVHKKDIELEASENGFCLVAPREDIEYVGCWILAHAIEPEKANATFSNGLLKVTVPLAESFEGVKVTIKQSWSEWPAKGPVILFFRFAQVNPST